VLRRLGGYNSFATAQERAPLRWYRTAGNQAPCQLGGWR